MRVALVAVCLAAAVIVSGCGGSGARSDPVSLPPLTKAEYLETVGSIVTEVRAESGRVTLDPTKVERSDVASVQMALRDLARRLGSVSPPAEVRDLHRGLVSALRGIADDLPALMATIANDPATGLDALLASEPLQALLGVSRGFADKGYDVDLEGT